MSIFTNNKNVHLLAALLTLGGSCARLSDLKRKFSAANVMSKTQNSDGSKATDIEKIAFYSAKRGPIVYQREFRGKLQASEKIELRAEKRMRVSPAKVKQYATVKRGDVLFVVDVKEFEQKRSESKEHVDQLKVDIAAARAQFDLAKKQFVRKQALVKRGIIAQKELDEAQKQYVTAETQEKSKELELRKAERELDAANQTVSSANVIAPITGVVTTIIAGGEEVNQSQSLAIISNPASLSLYVDVDESSVTLLPPGFKVDVTLDQLPDHTFKGTVKTSIATLKQSGGGKSYELQIDLEPAAIKNLNLRDGYDATMLAKFDRRENVIAVPLNTVKMNGDKPFILVAPSRGSVPAARAVKLGLRTELEVEVKDGIKEGELVTADTSESGGAP